MMDGDGRTFRFERKLPIAVALIAFLIFGALLLAERDSGAATVRERALAAAAAAQAAAAPNVPNFAQAAVPATPVTGDPLAAARNIAAQTSAIVAATPADPALCAALLAQRAVVVAQFAALIAAFPQFTVQFNAQRAAALAVIDAQLTSFGCAVPSAG